MKHRSHIAKKNIHGLPPKSLALSGVEHIGAQLGTKPTWNKPHCVFATITKEQQGITVIQSIAACRLLLSISNNTWVTVLGQGSVLPGSIHSFGKKVSLLLVLLH